MNNGNCGNIGVNVQDIDVMCVENVLQLNVYRIFYDFYCCVEGRFERFIGVFSFGT